MIHAAPAPLNDLLKILQDIHLCYCSCLVSGATAVYIPAKLATCARVSVKHQCIHCKMRYNCINAHVENLTVHTAA